MATSAPKPRRQIEFETRQRLIVEATRQLLAERGVETASMDEIAAAVDYTRRTLYAYFKSRDEILLLVLCNDLADRWRTQRNAIAKADTGLAKIRAWGESLFAYTRAHPHSIQLAAYWDYRGVDENRISDTVLDSFKSLNSELAEGLREIFRLGVADGSLRPDLQIDLGISQFLYSLRIVIHRALSQSYSFAAFDADEYVAHYLDLFTRGIRHRKDET